MYIRCASCRGTTRVPLGMQREQATCVNCGRPQSLERIDELGSTPATRFRKAQVFSERHGIDLASAYSVLLGLMPLQAATGIEKEATGPRDQGKTKKRTNYDRGFQDAVASGIMTIQMAIQRGDRVAFASRLARSHGLPMHVAFEVTDNKLELRKALDRRASQRSESAAAAAAVTRSPMANPYAIALATLCVGLLVWWAVGSSADRVDRADPAKVRPAFKNRAAPSVTSIHTVRENAEGKLTQLVGPTAKWVLDAYCAAGGEGKRKPVQVHAHGSSWLGIFREGGKTRAITIQRDEQAKSWAAGDGAEPIHAVPASFPR